MIVVLGSINLDIVLRPERLPAPGETVLTPGYATFPGGKGANQALAAQLAGADVAMVGCVGRDAFAEPALASLRATGVDITGVAAVDPATGLAIIAVDDAGQNQIIGGGGANFAVRATQLTPNANATLLLQMEIPHAENWAAIATAQAAGMRSVLNLAPAADIPEVALEALDVLIANEIEADGLARQFGRSRDEIGPWLSERFDLDCIVTLGEGGAVASLRDGRALSAPALPVEVADTTAAGDAFVGAYVAALDAGAPPETCLARGIAAGSLACTRPGAQPSLPDAAAIDAAFGNVEVSARR